MSRSIIQKECSHGCITCPNSANSMFWGLNWRSVWPKVQSGFWQGCIKRDYSSATVNIFTACTLSSWSMNKILSMSLFIDQARQHLLTSDHWHFLFSYLLLLKHVLIFKKQQLCFLTLHTFCTATEYVYRKNDVLDLWLLPLEHHHLECPVHLIKLLQGGEVAAYGFIYGEMWFFR